MTSRKTRMLTVSLIAALYVVLTFFPVQAFRYEYDSVKAFGGVIRPCRFTPAAPRADGGRPCQYPYGKFALGRDFGSLATFFGALGTYALRKFKFLSPVPPIVFNTIIIPFVLMYVYKLPDNGWIIALCVFAGEMLSCGVLGTMLVFAFEKTKSGKNIINILSN